MAHPSDIEASAAELMLVELLYGEVSGDEAEAARAVVASDSKLAADGEAYRGLRELMRELPDEEPPAAISAQLLHAAATQAPAPVAAKVVADAGLWASIKGFFAPIIMHPAMAAAATLVLVAGVAGTLYLRGEVEVSQPVVPSSATAPAAAEQRASTPADQPGLAQDIVTLSSGDEDEGIVDVRLEGSTLPGSAPAESHTQAAGPSKGRPMKKPARDPAPNGKLDLRERGEGEKRAVEKPEPTPPADEAKKPADNTRDTVVVGEKNKRKDEINGLGGSAGGGYGDGEDIGADDEAEAPAPPSEPGPAPAVTTDKAPSKKESESSSRRSELEELHARAVRAAGKGECATVASLGERIRKLDRAYYDKVFARDSKLAVCSKQKRK